MAGAAIEVISRHPGVRSVEEVTEYLTRVKRDKIPGDESGGQMFNL